MEQQQQLATVLQRLLEAGEGSFVILALQDTGQFVQFVAPAEDLLVLDVPAATLSDDERRRAEVFFADIGGFEEEAQAFQATLDGGPHAAAQVALEALRAVYEAPADAEAEVSGEFVRPGRRERIGAAQPGRCSLCGEIADNLTRRLWFRGITEAAFTRQSTMQVQQVCDACLSACRRRTRINYAVLGGVLAIVAGLIATAAILAP